MLYKYPRTPHLPFSPGASSDDKILKSIEHFRDMDVVITEKMDGENTTIYRDNYHARSLDSKHRDYHSYLLGSILPKIQWSVPDGWRICGEYMYAKHSIFYKNLSDYFLCFSIWNKDNICISWKDTKIFCSLYGINMVPELYIGKFDIERVKSLAESVVNRGGEGIVVRNAGFFSYDNFSDNIAKYVRKNHVQTDEHWSHGKVVVNLLS